MTIKCSTRLIVGVLLVSGLSACGVIKSWFPDKERDYQFTTEIPELIIPDDLKNKDSAKLPSRPIERALPEPDPVTGSRYTAESEDSATESADTNTAEESASDQTPESAPAASTSTASTLQIDQAKNAATRTVGKALTRQKLEVVERNIDKGYFYIKYDPKAEKVSDDSIWDEINFLFGDDPSQEKEYRITVQSLGAEMSEVTVQNSKGESLSNQTANSLLGLIAEGINISQQNSTPVKAEETTNEQPAPETNAEQSADEQPASEQQ